MHSYTNGDGQNGVQEGKRNIVWSSIRKKLYTYTRITSMKILAFAWDDVRTANSAK